MDTASERAGEIVTIAEAATRIGRPSQWLRRHLLAQEEKTGLTILVRVGAGGKRPTYRVHMGRLRVACPELFDLRDPIATALQESAIIGRTRLLELEKIVEEISCNIAALVEAMRKSARR